MLERMIFGVKNYFAKQDEGIGAVEMILILLVLVGLVLVFKTQILSLANSIFTNITKQIGKI